MLEVREVPGKGRGVFAARDIHAGEVVLNELPLVLYPQQATASAFCSHCLRAFNSLADSAAAVVPCGSCGRVGFCSSPCAAAAAADPGSHCPAVCALLAACNFTGLTEEQQSALQFLFRCCCLRQAGAAGDAAAAARFAGIASLSAPPPLPCYQTAAAGSDATSVRELHGRLSHALAAVGAAAAAGLTLDEAAELLRKDATNGYGVMAPSALDGERRVRGTAVYAHASLINHECLPNVARFDRFDAPAGTPSGASPAAAAAAGGGTAPPPGANTAVEFRALHGIPAGEEVTQSYFPLPWPMGERQQRCQEDYAFQCACPRCQEEATWTESEGEWETDSEDAGMAEAGGDAGAGPSCSSQAHHHHRQHQEQQKKHQHQHQQQGGGGEGPAAAVAAAHGADQAAPAEGQADAAYINLFLLKYVCPQEGCYGTLAPLAPAPLATDSSSGGGGAAAAAAGTMFECNMCGGRRSEAEFLAELEAAG